MQAALMTVERPAMMIVRLESFARHFRVRRSEWLLAVSAFVIGLTFLGVPVLFSRPEFAAMAYLATGVAWGTAITSIGLLRLAMLAINGAWSLSPYFRSAGAFLCAFVWFALFATQSFGQDPSQARWLWLVFMVFDILNAGDAAFDAGANKGRPRGRSNA